MPKKTKSLNTAVPLSTAARRLRLSWASAYRLILMGQLDGQLINGRWQISQESLDRVVKERSAAGDRAAQVAV